MEKKIKKENTRGFQKVTHCINKKKKIKKKQLNRAHYRK